MKQPIRIAITGATGQICYSLLFRIAAGDMLGKDQPIILQLFDIPESLPLFDGIVMELHDCAFPLLVDVVTTDNIRTAFKDIDIAILVGARPRTKNMQRKDLLAANGPIFTEQGKALDEVASRDVKVLVVGNPANTNTYITMRNAPGLNPENFSAMLRLDHNRALYQIAKKVQQPVLNIRKSIIWGNHSNTQYPDLNHAFAGEQKVTSLIDNLAWTNDDFIPTVQDRGMTIIAARNGKSSAASAANAIINHIHDWVFGTREDDWVSMGILSNGNYGIPEDVIYSFPVTCCAGKYQIVQGLEIDDFSHHKMKESYQELLEERDAIRHLI